MIYENPEQMGRKWLVPLSSWPRRKQVPGKNDDFYIKCFQRVLMTVWVKLWCQGGALAWGWLGTFVWQDFTGVNQLSVVCDSGIFLEDEKQSLFQGHIKDNSWKIKLKKLQIWVEHGFTFHALYSFMCKYLQSMIVDIWATTRK